MTDKTGGPAFPVVGHFYGDKLGGQLAHGMFLRDWFAGMAMQGFCASQPGADWSNQTIAREAYLLADDMLKAREAK